MFLKASIRVQQRDIESIDSLPVVIRSELRHCTRTGEAEFGSCGTVFLSFTRINFPVLASNLEH